MKTAAKTQKRKANPKRKQAKAPGSLELMSAELKNAAMRLEVKGLLKGEGSISIRIPGKNMFLLAIGDGKKPISKSPSTGFHFVPIQGFVGELDPVAILHRTVYQNRPDVGAVFSGSQKWGVALSDLSRPMPTIFDEQARQLGPEVSHLRLDGTNIAKGKKYASALQSERNAFLLENGSVLILGMTLDKAVFNAELLEKCAKAYMMAFLTGERILKIPFYVRVIANLKLKKDEKRSAEAYSKGEIPSGFKAY